MTATSDDTRAAFLRRIGENPDDDLPRLVYADWLEEREASVECGGCDGTSFHRYADFPDGSPNYSDTAVCYRCLGTGHVSNGYAARAELIRVQCELARLDSGVRCPVCEWPYGDACKPGDCSYRPSQESSSYPPWKRRQTAYHVLRTRERELLAAYRFDWCEVAGWSRGFVSVCRAPLAAIMEHGPALVREHPGCVVEVTDYEPWWDETWFPLREFYRLNEGVLPDEVFDLLDGYVNDRGQNMCACRSYSNRSTALAALNDAATRWCREQAEQLDEVKT